MYIFVDDVAIGGSGARKYGAANERPEDSPWCGLASAAKTILRSGRFQSLVVMVQNIAKNCIEPKSAKNPTILQKQASSCRIVAFSCSQVAIANDLRTARIKGSIRLRASRKERARQGFFFTSQKPMRSRPSQQVAGMMLFSGLGW